jgi:tRNA threonylcarbamoyl adenosine modification protein (Sua5/YciO/YrdC/YwlC family)
MRLTIHPTHPQPRYIAMAGEKLRRDGVVIYPTDSFYGLGCAMESQTASARIREIRKMNKHQFLTLVCRDLSELSTFARVDKASYRLIKSLTPGPYTFILQATRELPRRLQDPKRKTIGLRIPDNPTAQALLDLLDSPMLSATARDGSDDDILSDVDELDVCLGRRVDLFLDAGSCGADPTTVIDLSNGDPVLVRHGAGPVDRLLDLP